MREGTPFAISKVASHYITINYRESYNLFACCGILFNHESYLRGSNFFVKKVVLGALDILHNKRNFLELGQLEIKRDFGYSKKYVEAMWLMLQQEVADEFLICSGKSIYLKEIAEYIFTSLKLPLSKIRINKTFFRPTDIEDIYGSAEKAKLSLKWDYNMDFYQVLDVLIEEEVKNYKK